MRPSDRRERCRQSLKATSAPAAKPRPSSPGRTRRVALFVPAANWPRFTPPHWSAFTPPLTLLSLRSPRVSLVKDYNLRNKGPRVADIGQPAVLAKRGEVLLDVT